MGKSWFYLELIGGIKYIMAENISLIAADPSRKDLGFIDNYYYFDCVNSLGSELSDNDFQLDLPADEWERYQLQRGSIAYAPDTEYGGIIDRVKSNFPRVTVSGVTWRGMMARKVIQPSAGEAYKTVSGEAHEVIRELIGDEFGDLFAVSDIDSGIYVSFQFRYQNMLDGITRMLQAAGSRLVIRYVDGTVVLQAAQIRDLSEEIDLSEDYGVRLTADDNNYQGYNHVLCLGSGELAARTVVNIWRLPYGGWTTDSNHPDRPRGLEERTIVHDYPNAETVEELTETGIEKLLENGYVKSMQIDFAEAELDVDLGDIVAGRDRITGFYAKTRIYKKVVRFEGGSATISHEVDDKIDLM